MQLTVCLGVFFPTQAAAGNLDIDVASCGGPWRVQADGIELKTLMQRLAETADFSLSYLADENPIVTGDYSGSAGTVLKQLLNDLSLITTSQRDPNCETATKLLRIVILPVGEAADLPEPVAVPQGLQRYRRAHGMDPLTGQPVPRQRD